MGLLHTHTSTGLELCCPLIRPRHLTLEWIFGLWPHCAFSIRPIFAWRRLFIKENGWKNEDTLCGQLTLWCIPCYHDWSPLETWQHQICSKKHKRKISKRNMKFTRIEYVILNLTYIYCGSNCTISCLRYTNVHLIF